MKDERLAELKEKYKNRNLFEELAWGIYANHSGYTSKQDGEFLNWLCLMAYKALKERPQGEFTLNDLKGYLLFYGYSSDAVEDTLINFESYVKGKRGGTEE